MNKAKKNRSRRRNRDLRWLKNPGKDMYKLGDHRFKKIFGDTPFESSPADKPLAFWNANYDKQPLFSRLFEEEFDAADSSSQHVLFCEATGQ